MNLSYSVLVFMIVYLKKDLFNLINCLSVKQFEEHGAGQACGTE